MADLLSIGLSGLAANKTSLAVTGHNITNVNTPGFSRQDTGQATRIRQFSGAGARVACQMQAIDELRHVQTQIHAMSHYNKHFQIWR